MLARMRLGWVAVVGGVGGLAGCVASADRPVNPSFALTVDEAWRDVEAMRRAPAAAARPVVVIGGIYDPGHVVEELAERVRSVLGPGARVIAVGLMGTDSMDAARLRVLKAVDGGLLPRDPVWTAEVDVVGFSLGALAARHAAADTGPGRRRLRMGTLYTIGGPHGGAEAAKPPAWDRRINAMRPGSAYMAWLDERAREAAYGVVAYVRLGDSIVTPERAGYGGEPPFWVQNQPLRFAHAMAYKDPRILADIGRRLRGEAPHTAVPAEPLP